MIIIILKIKTADFDGAERSKRPMRVETFSFDKANTRNKVSSSEPVLKKCTSVKIQDSRQGEGSTLVGIFHIGNLAPCVYCPCAPVKNQTAKQCHSEAFCICRRFNLAVFRICPACGKILKLVRS